MMNEKSMQQDRIFQQQEFAQAYQLGSLEGEYALDAKKLLVTFGLLLICALIALFIVFSQFSTAADSKDFLIPSFIFFLLVGGGIQLAFYFSYRHLQVCVYTNGLLYRYGNRSRVVYWQQMKEVYTDRGTRNLKISVKNEAGISIPMFISRSGELRARIKQGITNYSNPG